MDRSRERRAELSAHLRSIWTSVAAAVVLAWWAILGPSLIPVPEPPLRVGVHEWIGFAPILLADSLGLVDHSRIRLSQLASSPGLTLGLRSGTFDAAGLSLDEALRLLDDGGDIVAVVAMDESDGADAIVARKGLDDIASLRGRRVGVDLGSTGGFFLSRALEASGIPTGEVHLVDLPPSRHRSAFAAGEVDAVATFEPVVTSLVEDGGRVLFDSTRLPGEIVDVLVVRREVAERRPEDVRALVAVWHAAVDHLGKDRADSLVRLSKATGTTVADLDRALGEIRFIDPGESARRFAGSPSPIEQHALRLAAWMRSGGHLRYPERAARLFALPDAGPGGGSR